MLTAFNEVYVRHDSDECRFLDIGSGLGNVFVALAVAHRTDVLSGQLSLHGVEINQELAELSKRVLGPADVRIGPNVECADCLDFSIGSYDIIHHYGPFKDKGLQERLDRKIMDEMHPGAFLLSRLREDASIFSRTDFVQIPVNNSADYHVFRKFPSTRP
ncbi:MAG: class I SAM-dependent methyltransferase [Candidatus Paceibacterota bacterium]